MEEEIHVVDSGSVTATDTGSMVVLTDADGKQQILHLPNDDQATSTEMLLEDLPEQLREQTMTIMQREADDIDYLSHQRAAEVLQSMGEGMVGEGMAGQIEEVNAEQNQAVVYVEGDEGVEGSITSDAIAAALQQAGAADNGDEQSQVIVLEGGSDGLVDMSDVGEDFQGTLIVIMQQDEQQSNVTMDATDNLQKTHTASVFVDPKSDHISEENVAAFHPTEVFHQPDESFKENIECQDVSQEPVLEKPFHCKDCDKKFAWKRSLMVHEHVHTGKDVFVCQDCGKSYSGKVSFRSHLATHTKQEDKPYSCDVCGKRFTKKWDWETHKWQHTGHKKYICEHCGKTYARNSDLRRHVLSHTGNKPFQCRYCGKRFITRWHHNYHERRHTGVKPYQCQLCWKEFMQKCHLDRHEITHAAETYSCQYCGRKYMHKHEVMRHERTHVKHTKEMDISTSDSITLGNIEPAADDVVGNVDDALEYLMAFAQGQVKIDTLKENEIQGSSVTKPKVKCTDCKRSFADTEELLIHKEIQPNCCVNMVNTNVAAGSIACKYCERIFKYKTSFLKHVTSHAAFHFDDEFEELKLEIEERAQGSPSNSSIFVCVRCCRAYSAEEKLIEHKRLCTEMLEKSADQMVNDATLILEKLCKKTNLDEANEEENTVSQFNAGLSDAGESDNDKEIDIDRRSDAGASDGLLGNTDGGSQNPDKPIETTNKNQRVKTILAFDDDGQEVQVPLSSLLYICRFCSSEFKYRTSFERHEEQHGGNTIKKSKCKRPFICTLCGKDFRRPFHLVRHMDTHSKRTISKTVESCKINPKMKPVKIKGKEIQEIINNVRDDNVLSHSDEFGHPADIEDDEDDFSEDCQTKEEQTMKTENTEITAEPKQILKQVECKSKNSKNKSPNKSKFDDASTITTTTRSQRSIRLPKRFRTDGDESTPEEEVMEEILQQEKDTEENKKQATLASTRKRGRPRKVIDENLEKNEEHKKVSSPEDAEDKKHPTVTSTRKRGRPRKLIEENLDKNEESRLEGTEKNKDQPTITPARKRGRPRKSIEETLDKNEPTLEEHIKGDTIPERSPKEKIEQTTLSSTKRRGRPKKVVKETFECKQCKKIFPFQSLLRNHNKAKHKIHEIDVDCTPKQPENLDLGNDGSKEASTKTTENVLTNRDSSECNDSSVDGTCQTVADGTQKKESTQDSLPDADLVIDKDGSTTESGNEIKPLNVLGPKGICTRSKSNEYLCDQCGRKFPSQAHLLRHKKAHDKNKRSKSKTRTITNKQHRCSQCHKVFKTSTLLKRHELLHMDKKGFKCTTCAKSFRRSDDLKRHNRTHSGKKPFTCEVCGKTFAYRFPLTVHLQSHTGARPHMCDVCGKMFAKKYDMAAHRNMHSGNTPHVCNICQKKYGRKADLDRHMTKHTGTQPLSCSFCDRRFSSRWHLKYHERTHTGEKPYACEICDRKFAQLPHLNKHMALHKQKATTSIASNIETSIDKEFDDNALLKSVVHGLQQASEGDGSLETLQENSQQIIQVMQVEASTDSISYLILP